VDPGGVSKGLGACQRGAAAGLGGLAPGGGSWHAAKGCQSGGTGATGMDAGRVRGVVARRMALLLLEGENEQAIVAAARLLNDMADKMGIGAQSSALGMTVEEMKRELRTLGSTTDPRN